MCVPRNCGMGIGWDGVQGVRFDGDSLVGWWHIHPRVPPFSRGEKQWTVQRPETALLYL